MTAGNHARTALADPRIGAVAAALCLGAAACAAGDSSTAGASGPATVGAPGGAGGASGVTGGQPWLAGAGGAGGQAGSFVPPAAGAGVAGGAGSGQAGAPSAGAGGAGTGGMTATSGTGGSAGSPAPTGDTCAQWKAARTNLTEDAWNGDAAACEPGDMTEQARAVAYGLHSLYRTMAGLQPVEMTAEGNRLAQECALLMHANGRISHTPDQSWMCWTMERREAANSSSLSGGGAISSVDGYMVDPGNETTLGHRRWILSNTLAGIGFGSTGRFSCQYQPPLFRGGSAGEPWVAWPPPGQIPIQAFSTRYARMDQTGWSVQSDSVDLSGAQVSVTSGGTDLAVSVTQLLPGYGSRYAIRFNPMGWTTTAGTTYSVQITGTSMPIEYEVEVVDCP